MFDILFTSTSEGVGAEGAGTEEAPTEGEGTTEEENPGEEGKEGHSGTGRNSTNGHDYYNPALHTVVAGDYTNPSGRPQKVPHYASVASDWIVFGIVVLCIIVTC